MFYSLFQYAVEPVSCVEECIDLCNELDLCNYVTYMPSEENQYDSCGLFGFCAVAREDCGGCTSWEKTCLGKIITLPLL